MGSPDCKDGAHIQNMCDFAEMNSSKSGGCILSGKLNKKVGEGLRALP